MGVEEKKAATQVRLSLKRGVESGALRMAKEKGKGAGCYKLPEKVSDKKPAAEKKAAKPAAKKPAAAAKAKKPAAAKKVAAPKKAAKKAAKPKAKKPAKKAAKKA